MANNLFRKITKSFMDLLCPEKATCLLCSKEIKKGEFCTKCELELVYNRKNRCARCSRPTVSVEDNVCEECKNRPTVFYDQAVAPFIYTGTALRLMRALKYHDRRDVAKFFATHMEKEYHTLPKTDIIVPVPMHKSKYVDRMYSQSTELAVALGERVGAKVDDTICEKKENTVSQTSLTKEKRLENVKGSFKVLKKDEIKDKSVLIVDDVFTTGATCSELARTLKKSGAKKVYVLCACITNYKL